VTKENSRNTAFVAPTVGVILVNWNGWKYSVAAYDSLSNSKYQNWTLVIVDNASADNSVHHLRNLGPRVHLLESRQNLGFAGGCNLALQAAENLNLDYVFFLNNDAVVTPDTIGDLLSASRSVGDKAVLGSVVRYRQTADLQFFGSAQSAQTGAPEWFPPSEDRLADSPDLIESDFIFGAALFAPMAIFRDVGRFDERFFLNFEETDWCYRARRKGYPCFVVKRALAYHEGSASLGALTGPMQVYFIQRNELLFFEKHCSKRQLVGNYFKALRNTQGAFRRALGRHRGERSEFDPRSKALFLGIRDYAFRRFGDCPPIIRRLAKQYSQSNAATSELA
jgi:GT2 family glycosyltransferase